MSWNQNPPGGQPGGFGSEPAFGGQGTPPGGQGHPGQQGGFGGQPPQGFGGQPPQGFGGQPPQGFGGQPPQGFGGQPPQGYGGQPPQGYGGQPPQGYGGQPPQGFGGQQGFGTGFPPGPTGQPPKKKSTGMLIGIAVAAVAVVALAGLLIMLFTGGDDDPLPPPPPPPPTATPTPTPTTGPTTQTPPPGGAIQFDNGLSVTPPSGWTVAEQDSDSALLRDSSGRAVIVSTGRADDPRGQVTGIIDRLTANGSDVQKADVRTPEHPTLDIATQSAVMTVASGGGSARLGIYSVVSSRKSDNVAFAAAAVAPAADYRDEAFTGQIDEIVGSLLTSQLAGG